MSPDVVLLILRIISAILLLLFLGVMAWLIFQDMRLVRAVLDDRRRHHGQLRATRVDDDGDDQQLVFPLSPVTSIGRASSNSVVLDDDYVSNEHALLLLRGQQWWLEDLDSRNGTLINGVRLTEPTVVGTGDVIVIGNIHLRVEPLVDPRA